ncbi:MAG: putative Ig domain-containing protein [Acidobacteriota bacterium]|nr:putative Ig domain-containing protein [Acidobacteriota bacterium]
MKFQFRERLILAFLFVTLVMGMVFYNRDFVANAISKPTSTGVYSSNPASGRETPLAFNQVSSSIPTPVVSANVAQMGCTLPSFAQAPTSPESVGLDPHYVCVGNFNADNHLDIITTNSDENTLSVLLGDGTGNFTETPGPRIPTGIDPITVEDGDFNNDGKSDIAITNQGSASLTILLGNGDGTFVQAMGSPITVGTFPRAVAVGSFNGDANQDLVVSNGGSDNLTILLGNGDGTFAETVGSPMPAGDAPFHSVIGNYNGDANADLAVANLGEGTVRIFLGDGLGGFIQPNPAIPVGDITSFIAKGDFNGDTFEDLAVTNRISANLVILLGNGTGGFSQAPGSPYNTGLDPMVVAAADLNLDGKLDLAVANESAANTFVFLGNGNGTFGSPTTLTKGQVPTHLAIGDFNEDTKPDIATSDAGDRTVTILLNTCNNCQPITLSPETIPAGTAGTGYSETFTATGGTAPYTFSLSGTLPTGMSLSGDTLSGIPTQTGSFPVTVTATDINNCTGNRNYTLVVNCQTITVNPATLSDATAGTNFNQTFTHSGGIGAVGFNLTGTLPNGMSFTGATLSGTPTQTGNFPITVTATDANGCTGSRNYTLVVNCQTITVNPATIPAGTVGSSYSQTFTHLGGIGTVNFNLTGTLPNGISFSGDTLSGTPTQSGSFPITVTATDANGCTGSRNYTLVVNCQTITVNPATIPAGTVNSMYSQTFTHSGGISTVSFNLTGALPNGITFSGATLSGTPTQTGSFPITVTATDANGCTGNRNYTLMVNCQTITVNPATIPTGTAGTSYSQTFTQTGGVGAVNFNLTGSLPTGLSFAGATLSGTPTQTGSFPITVTATDANGCTGSRNYTLTINCQTYSVLPVTISTGTANVAYSQSFSHTGGIGSVTFSQSGKLPTGISFSGGTLSGTPTQTGSFPISITATDSNGCTATRNYNLVVNCQAISINPTTIPAGTANVAYSQTFSQVGGIGSVTFTLQGALPNGMNFVGGTLSGTPTQSGSFPITVTATDSNNCTGFRDYVLLINCSTISVNPATIPSGTVNAFYSQSFTNVGGVGTITFSLAGKLPAGMSFSGATLSGTPTQAGVFPIAVTATDSNNCTGGRNYTLVINCQTITVNPTTIPAATAGINYSQNFTQVGGVGTVNFSLSGPLPNGMSFTGSTLSGVPTQSGNFPITVTATDSNNCTGSRLYNLVVNLTCGTIGINPSSLPNGFVGTTYNQSLSGTGGFGSYTFALDSGTLPPGVNLSGSALNGNPTTVGTFNFVLRATDGLGCTGTQSYSVTISSGGLQFFPLPAPVRLLDTRSGQPACFTPGVPINGENSLTQLARGTCGIPAAARAVTGNVTVVVPGSGGFLTIYPSDAAQPLVANTNYAAGDILNNVFTVGLGNADGSLKIFAQTTTHVVMDITGYYAPPATGGLYFHPLPTPIRLLETRAGQPGCFTPNAPLPGNVDSVQQGTTTCSGVTIPAAAKALVGNATTVSPAAAGFLTMYPADAARPLIASGNYKQNEILNSPFTVGLSPTGQFKIYTTATTELVIDVLGYYSPDAVDVNGTGLLFNPLTPTRLLETRPSQPGCTTPGVPLAGGTETSQQARNFCTIAATAQAIVGNVTVVQPASGGFLTFWPSNATRPLVATSNYTAGSIFNRYFTVGLGTDGAFKMFASNTTHVVIDVSGYFAP